MKVLFSYDDKKLQQTNNLYGNDGRYNNQSAYNNQQYHNNNFNSSQNNNMGENFSSWGDVNRSSFQPINNMSIQPQMSMFQSEENSIIIKTTEPGPELEIQVPEIMSTEPGPEFEIQGPELGPELEIQGTLCGTVSIQSTRISPMPRPTYCDLCAKYIYTENQDRLELIPIGITVQDLQ